ncbi:MAG: hypothetical protein WDW36_009956 [Sanguina aurantia]
MEYQASNITAEDRQKLAWSLIRELSIHSSKEEEVLYPVVREKLGALAAQTLLDEHQALKQLTAKLSGVTIEKLGQAQFDELLRQVVTELMHHIEDEEETFIPKLRKMDGVDEDLLCKLGAQFDAAGAHAVSRPHPWAPNTPPLNWMVNTATAPLDYALDLVR